MASSWCLVLLGLVALQGLTDGHYASLRDVISGQRMCPCSDNGGQDDGQDGIIHLRRSFVSISHGQRLPTPQSGDPAELDNIRRMLSFYALSRARFARNDPPYLPMSVVGQPSSSHVAMAYAKSQGPPYLPMSRGDQLPYLPMSGGDQLPYLPMSKGGQSSSSHVAMAYAKSQGPPYLPMSGGDQLPYVPMSKGGQSSSSHVAMAFAKSQGPPYLPMSGGDQLPYVPMSVRGQHSSTRVAMGISKTQGPPYLPMSGGDHLPYVPMSVRGQHSSTRVAMGISKTQGPPYLPMSGGDQLPYVPMSVRGQHSSTRVAMGISKTQGPPYLPMSGGDDLPYVPMSVRGQHSSTRVAMGISKTQGPPYLPMSGGDHLPYVPMSVRGQHSSTRVAMGISKTQGPPYLPMSGGDHLPYVPMSVGGHSSSKRISAGYVKATVYDPDYSRNILSPAYSRSLFVYLDPRPYQPRQLVPYQRNHLSYQLLQYFIHPGFSGDPTAPTYQSVSRQVVVLIRSASSQSPSGPSSAAQQLIDFLLGGSGAKRQPQNSAKKYMLMIQLVSYLSGADEPGQPSGDFTSQINKRVSNLLNFLSSPSPSGQQSMEFRLSVFFQSVSSSGPSPSQPSDDSATLQTILNFLSFLSHVEQSVRPADVVEQNYKQISVEITYILETLSSPQAGGSTSADPHAVQRLIRFLTGTSNPGEPSVSPAQQQQVTKLLFVYLSESYTSSGPSTSDVSHQIKKKLLSLIQFLGQHPQESTYESTLIYFSQHKTSLPSSSQSSQFMAYLSHVSSSKPQSSKKPKPSVRPAPRPSETYEVVTHKMVFLLESVVETSSQQPHKQSDIQRIRMIKALVSFMSGSPGPGQLPVDPIQKYRLIIKLINYMAGVNDGPDPVEEVADMVLRLRRRVLRLVDFLVHRQEDPEESMVSSLFVFFKYESSSQPNKPSEDKELKKVLQFLVFLNNVEDSLKRADPYDQQIEKTSITMVFLLEKVSQTSPGVNPSVAQKLIRILTGADPSVSPSQQHKVTKLLFVYLSDVQTGPSQPDVGSQIRDKLKKLLWFLEDPGQNPNQPMYQSLKIFFSHQQINKPTSQQTTFMLSYLKQVNYQPGPSRPSGHIIAPSGIFRPTSPSKPSLWDDRQYEHTSSTVIYILKKMSSEGPNNQVNPSTVNLLIRLLTGKPIRGEPNVSPGQRRQVTRLLFVYLASESVQPGHKSPSEVSQDIHFKLLRMLRFLQQPHQPQQSTYTRLMIFFSKEQTVGPAGKSQSILAYFNKITNQSQPNKSKTSPTHPSWDDNQYHQTSSTLVLILKKISSEGPNNNVDPSTVDLLIRLLSGQSIPGEPSVSPSQRRKTTRLLFIYLASESVQPGQPGRQPDIGQEVHAKLIRMIRFLQQPRQPQQPQQSTYSRLMIFFSKQQTVGPAPGQSQSIMAYFQRITKDSQPQPKPKPKPHPRPIIPSIIDNANTKQTSMQLVVILKKVSSQQPSGQVNPHSLSDLIDILLGKPGTSPAQQQKVTKLLLVYLSSSTTTGPSKPGPIDSIINSKLVSLLRFLSGPKPQPQQSTYERLIVFFSKQQTTSSRGPSVSQSKTVLAYLKHTSSTSKPQGQKPKGPQTKPGKPGKPAQQQSIAVAIAKVVEMLKQPNVQQAIEGSVEVVQKLVVILSHQATVTSGKPSPRPGPGGSGQPDSIELDTKVVVALIEYLAGVSPSGNVESQIESKIVKIIAYLKKTPGNVEKNLVVFLKKEQSISGKPSGDSDPSISISRVLGFLSHIQITTEGPLGPKGPSFDDSALIRALSDSLLAFIRASKPKQSQESKHVIHIVINVLSDISAKPQPNPSDYEVLQKIVAFITGVSAGGSSGGSGGSGSGGISLRKEASKIIALLTGSGNSQEIATCQSNLMNLIVYMVKHESSLSSGSGSQAERLFKILALFLKSAGGSSGGSAGAGSSSSKSSKLVIKIAKSHHH